MNVDTLTAKYVELRDRKAAIKRAADEETAKLDVLQDKIEDKIKEAKNEYDRLVSETPIGKLSIRQIQDYFNSIVRNIKQ